MKADISERVVALLKKEHYSQKSLAQKCEINYQNFNKCIKGKMPWTDRTILKIAEALNVNYKWLRDGVGAAYLNDKKESDAQFAELQDYVNNVNDYKHVVNTINGSHNSGTQTINSGAADNNELLLKIASLEAAITEKDKTINLLKDLLSKASMQHNE